MIKNYNEYLNGNFWKWFGNSKVVDEQGNPIIMYHGTDVIFNEFNPSKRGSVGKGIYLTKYTKDAKIFGKNIIPLYVKMENPFIADDKINDIEHLGSKLKRESIYDGIIYRGIHVVFYPEQVKSATNNNGNFDNNNPNINEKTKQKPLF